MRTRKEATVILSYPMMMIMIKNTQHYTALLSSDLNGPQICSLAISKFIVLLNSSPEGRVALVSQSWYVSNVEPGGGRGEVGIDIGRSAFPIIMHIKNHF